MTCPRSPTCGLAIALALAIASCSKPADASHPPQPRASLHEAVLATEGPGDNTVAAHAPDAMVPVQQGYSLPAHGHGLRQSPINILTKDVEPAYHLVAAHYGPSREHIHNRGHTIQLDYDAGSYIEFEGERYDLLQLHFHTPSEHRIDGVTFPLEVHLVHKRREDPDGVPHYLVIGALCKCGEDSPFLRKFLDRVPEHEDGRVDFDDVLIHANEVLGGELDYFYHYTGSLTTPPYTETVHWLILQRIFDAGPEQIERINRIEGNNARHVQALEGRTVEWESVGR